MTNENKIITYSWAEFDVDVDRIVKHFEQFKPHVIGIHRGSLPLAVKLSHKFNNGMSIIKHQTRDGGDKIPKLILNEIPDYGKIIVVDDIVDTGRTFNDIREFLIDYNVEEEDIIFVALHDNNTITKNINYRINVLNMTDGMWVSYPWE